MMLGGSQAAILPHTPEEQSVAPRAVEVDTEMGGMPPALYDEQAWAVGETMRQSDRFAEEDYVPATLARQHLHAVVADMDAMRKKHHAMMIEVRKNYETIGEETKKYYTKYIGDLRDRYNRSLHVLKKDVDEAKAAEAAMRAEVVPLRDELAAREGQVDDLQREVEALDAARSAATEEAAAAKATAEQVAAQAAEDAERNREASAEAARAAALAAADAESQRQAEREALRSGNEEAAAAAKAQREAAEARARAAEESSRRAQAEAKAAQVQAAEAEQEAVMDPVVQKSAAAQALPGAPEDALRVQQLEASVVSLEESIVKVEAELQEKNAQIAELCKQLRSGEEIAALEQQRAAEAAAIEAGDTQAAAAAKAEREALEARARESEAAAAAAAAQAVAARAKPAERAVYKVNLALLRARLNSQLQKTELATNLVESTQKRVAIDQQDKLARVSSAQAELAQAQQVAAAVSDGLDVEGVAGSADAMAKVAEAQQQLSAAQQEVAGLREHEALLERQREELEKEKNVMEAALAQQTEDSTRSATKLKAEVARLEAAGKASTENMQKQKELSERVVERLNADLVVTQKELKAAEAIVKRPPAGRKPSEKKADREKVTAIKTKIESLGLSIQQLTDGAKWMEQASEESESDQVSAEAADLMAHSDANIERIGQLEAQVANLQSANAALLENAGDTSVDEAVAGDSAQPVAAGSVSKADSGNGQSKVGGANGDKVLAAKLARAEARAAAAEKALDDAKLSGKTSGGGSSGGKASAADAKKAKAAEAKIKQLEAKNAKLADSLKIEKEKAAAASAGAKEGAAAEREKKKLAADAEKKLKAAAAETEKAEKRAEKKAEEAAQLAEKLAETETELTKLKKQGAGASKELESLREQAAQLEVVQAHEAELDEQLKTQTTEMNQLETRYKEQVTLRKKYYNMIEDMKGKIRVYARCRPMAKYEIEKECQPVVSFPDEYTVELKMEKGPPRQFAWDCAFTPASTQEETYEETAALIQSAVDGYNVCVFAYGQTGSGKTFTMVGAPGMEGILPRAMRDIYEKKAEMAADYDMNVKCYMLELYNDQLVDLLVSKADKKAKKNNSGKEEQLQIKKDAKGMIFVPGSTVVDCPELSDLEHCWELGEKSRHVGATKMNAGSSRSHLIVSMLLETTNKQTGKSAVGKLSLIDLAGSERAGKTGATAERLREAQSINKSLSALGDVISALSSGEKFIPYRNNKLTLLMSDSLGGNAKTLMYVNISPADYNLEETLTSLAYAARVKLITNDAAKNEESKEVHRLKEQLKAVKTGELSPDDIDL